jgi:hypothetical protein
LHRPVCYFFFRFSVFLSIRAAARCGSTISLYRSLCLGLAQCTASCAALSCSTGASSALTLLWQRFCSVNLLSSVRMLEQHMHCAYMYILGVRHALWIWRPSRDLLSDLPHLVSLHAVSQQTSCFLYETACTVHVSCASTFDWVSLTGCRSLDFTGCHSLQCVCHALTCEWISGME